MISGGDKDDKENYAAQNFSPAIAKHVI